MRDKGIKISFTLDEKDAAYFKGLLRDARKYAEEKGLSEISASARALVVRVRQTPGAPGFALEAIETLEALVAMAEDKDFGLPKNVANRVIAALAYFAQPQDLIPDHIPALGFLDDAILIKIVEQEFTNELWGYKKFVTWREGGAGGQRPWIDVSEKRMPGRIAAKRKEIRAEINRKNAKSTRRRWLW